ncbi:MAG: hypothetical protein EMLJLAPB_00165 [Candidatus Argoarchaeum ethanivorans]|uniref:Uncharacterized protein n=1 Tax=Candidatus Argoarchaeum ethanivorans TaxID=2608793 RepID=A0A811T841_9EURY|nr:MAG: hypothetical protein EMLJLAPB_00165 [Candidatus Argoarchaeum ethanivorans]
MKGLGAFWWIVLEMGMMARFMGRRGRREFLGCSWSCSSGIFTSSGSAVINGARNTTFDFQIPADSFNIAQL